MEKNMKIWNIQKITTVAATFAFVTASISAAPYTDNGDGTVTDTLSGLVWQKCSMGQTNDATCSGTATTATWQNSLNYCKNLTLAGKTWRLPSVNELKTIIDRGQAAAPFIDQTAFPGTVATYYWSASTYVPFPTDAWYVYFTTGVVNYNNKTNSYYVRCVSAGP